MPPRSVLRVLCPLPTAWTVSVKVGFAVKVAVTVRATDISGTLQIALELAHAPVQPVNTEFASGAADRTTAVSIGKE